VLVTRSHYSLRYGTLSVPDLARLAAEGGHRALLLADRMTSAAQFDFIKACSDQGIQPALGIEFVVENKTRYWGIAQNAEGLEALNALLTQTLTSSEALPLRAPELACVEWVYPHEVAPESLRPDEWLALRPSLLPRLIRHPIKTRLDRCVAWQLVTFADATGFRLHRMLRAVDLNVVLPKLDTSHHAPADEHPLSLAELTALYADYPQVWQNTEALFARCAGITLDTTPHKNRQTYTGASTDDRALLSKLAHEGAAQRYGHSPNLAEARRRVEHELKIIEQLGFSAYFLITWDIVRYAKHRSFYHVGRGSGANSIVSYCMGITDVCPIELDLYFERFLNPSRTSPPDFDLDFSWADRDEVIDYIFKRYGHDSVCLMGAYGTFGYSSTVREIGKVLGLPKAELDTMADDPAALAVLPGPHGKALRRCVELLNEVPNIQSIHAGGMLISEGPMARYTACTITPKGFPVAQMDMYIAEDAGFYKYDILSQRGLGHIKTALELVAENRGEKPDIHRIETFKNDPEVKAYIRVGDTLGCFYIESPAMRQLLKKLRCDDYIRLVAASSIIRPGVAKSGMMQQYIRRFNNPAEVEYLHPKMEELLRETYGVMVYQEDVIKVATHFGGLDPAEGDLLRRAMSGKTRGVRAFEVLKEKFFDRCHERGIDSGVTAEVWRQMESFGGYSFSKAHSASFAVESYQSLFLKTHYPLEFMVGVINNFGGFYRTEVYVHQARRMGATLHAPCIQHSRHLTHLYGTDVYLGFVHVKGLEAKWAEAIPRDRELHGEFRDLDNLLRRLPIPDEQLVILIRVGAVRSFGEKKSLLWLAKQKLASRPMPVPELFGIYRDEYELPQLETEPKEDLLDELELLGFTVADPFELLDVAHASYLLTRDMLAHVGSEVEMLGWYVARKSVRTVRGDIMYFGTWMDREALLFDTVHFPSHPEAVSWRGGGFYKLRGQMVEEFGHPSLEVSNMVRV
jgi:DNA-directed DNA polymerase III PolC